MSMSMTIITFRAYQVELGVVVSPRFKILRRMQLQLCKPYYNTATTEQESEIFEMGQICLIFLTRTSSFDGLSKQ